MIQELTIDNLAIIDHLTLTFADHMTVLLGETGAGKSIIIDAVGLLAGGRGSQEFIRRGAEKLSLQGQFTLPTDTAMLDQLDQLGIPYDESGLIISREIHRNGRNAIRINGTLVNTTILKQVGRGLVDIQGQNEHQQLMQPESHLGMLDQYAQQEVDEIKQQYHTLYQQYRHLSERIKAKKANEQQWAQRLDMLRYQVNEIEEANLSPNEEEELRQERERLSHFQQINDALQTVVGMLNESEPVPVLDQLGASLQDLAAIATYDQDYQDLSKTFDEAYYSLQDVAAQASRQLDALEYDPRRLSEIDDRLTQIGNLEHKYGSTINDILTYYDQISQELSTMEEAAHSDEDLDDQIAHLATQLTKLGQKLSQIRQQAAERLAQLVDQQLHDLYMEKAIFKVHFDQVPAGQFLATGIDEVEFYIQTNQGESMGPLARIASGGELSRVMLALKTVFASAEGVTSIIFDEVDTGVSGRVAQAIADKIRLIAQHSQVLCITHLPQVAAVAQHHFLIQKEVHDQRTITTVSTLNEQQRVEELARMLAGETVTELALEHAQELLEMAKEKK